MNKGIWVGVVVVVLVVGFFMFGGSGDSDLTGSVVNDCLGDSCLLGDSEDVVKIPLSEISNKAKFYEQGNINYFVVKASDGSVKVAFDACDVCGGSKGYRQEGNDMVCNSCGRHFDIDSLGEKNIYGGGCWPGHLLAEIDGDDILIKISDIEKGGYRF